MRLGGLKKISSVLLIDLLILKGVSYQVTLATKIHEIARQLVDNEAPLN